MKKKITLFLLMLMLLLTGCGAESQGEPVSEDGMDYFADYVNDGATIFDSAYLTFGLEYEEGTDIDLVYEGGEIEIPLQIEKEGIATVGIMLFLDGIQQPYKVSGVSEEYENMHVFELESDDKFIFTVSFVPVTGQKGEELELTLIGLSKPYFQPDLVNTFDYVSNVADNDVCVTCPVSFEANPDTFTYDPNNSGVMAYNLTVTQENLTEEAKKKYYIDLEGEYQDPGYSPDAIADDHTVYTQLFIDGESEIYFQTKYIGDSETIHITYKIYGAPGYQFAACFFANHKQIALSEELFQIQEELEANKMTVIEFDLKTSELGDKTTFYGLLLPRNRYLDFDSTYALFTRRTYKILLHKEYVEGVE